MSSPNAFSWVEAHVLAAMAQPAAADEYAWLREQGVQLLISLCADPPQRSWLNEAGLFSMHIPVEDMHPPTQKQIDLCMSAIDKAHAKGIGVGIHCGAGMGRTGTMLACYFVKQGMTAPAAIAHVRRIRPGSIETPEQTDTVRDYARRLKRQDA